jgi:hypothetical protein
MNIDIRGTEKREEGTRDVILDSIQTMVEIKKKRHDGEKTRVHRRGSSEKGSETRD